METLAKTLSARFEHAPVNEVLEYFFSRYRGKIALASSLGAEDQVLTEMIAKHDNAVAIFTLDTGRLPEETHALLAQTQRHYGIRIGLYFPEASDIEALYAIQGSTGFYESVENRKACCYARKLAPLRRALEGCEVWITGLRREQSPTREDVALVEYDAMHKMLKLNPLIAWSEADVWEYIGEHAVPYNGLQDIGYRSIGCAPCTRAVEADGDIRSGRWWWESPEHKECGLHIKEQQ